MFLPKVIHFSGAGRLLIQRKKGERDWRKPCMHCFRHILSGLSLSSCVLLADQQPGSQGVSGSGAPDNKIVSYVADRNWTAINWDPAGIAPGGALDFSGFLDAPAGKYGNVIIKDGRFSFEGNPEKPVRFYGTNLTHESPFLTRVDAETLAGKLAAEGFNAVRLHMNERWLAKGDGATEFDPVQKDKMDYLLSCLRKKGIYYVMTIYSGAYFPKGAIRDIREFSDREFHFEMKGLAMVSGDAMDYMHKYAKSLLCTVNPYTGLAPRDDPALIGIELTNEDPLNNFKKEYPEFTPIFTAKCQEYLAGRLGRAPSGAEVADYYNRFLLYLQGRFYNAMRDYLRNELGIRKPLNDVNCRNSLAFALVRDEFDYVDVHAYWDLYRSVGAEFGGGMFAKGKTYTEFLLKFANPVTGQWTSQTDGATGRIFGKPFSCGEFDMCYPAPDRAFTAPLQSALAGLQGWQMILHYAYASRPDIAVRASAERKLNVATSPLFLLSDRIGNALFAQGEVAESPVKIPLVVTADYIYGKLKTVNDIPPPESYSKLGFSCQIGTIVADDKTDLSGYPCVVIPSDMTQIPESVRKVKFFRPDGNLRKNLGGILPERSPGTVVSSTGQIVMNSRDGSFGVSTARSECLLLSKNVASLEGRALSVSGNSTPATCFVTSLDQRALKESKRMLFLYLTDMKNSGTVVDFKRQGGRVVVKNEGSLPYLIRRAEISVSVNLADRPLPRVFALKSDGSRSSEAAVTKTDRGFGFKADSVTSADVFAGYELVWE